MQVRKLSDFRPRILVFNGSPRRERSCAGQASKTQRVVEWAVGKWMPFADFDVVDLSVGGVNVQPCKGCVSTSGGMHCHWKCTCYSKGSDKAPDLMYEADVYDRLEACDGFLVASPVHWYSVSTQVKAMFDRLVCANLTLTAEQAQSIFGKGNTKDPELTGRAELGGRHRHLLRNHLEGRVAAFYVHGDDGADDYAGDQPETGDEAWDVRDCVMPLVYQCRYSGIDCPDELVEAFYVNKGKPYFQANLDMPGEDEFTERMDGLVSRLVDRISKNKQRP
jgi:multimeric flavodoxin WrbA